MKEELFIKNLGECLFEPSLDIGVDTILKELDGWDSLGRLSIAAFLQERFGLIVDTKTLLNCKTLGDIVALAIDKLET